MVNVKVMSADLSAAFHADAAVADVHDLTHALPVGKHEEVTQATRTAEGATAQSRFSAYAAEKLSFGVFASGETLFVGDTLAIAHDPPADGTLFIKPFPQSDDIRLSMVHQAWITLVASILPAPYAASAMLPIMSPRIAPNIANILYESGRAIVNFHAIHRSLLYIFLSGIMPVLSPVVLSKAPSCSVRIYGSLFKDVLGEYSAA